MTRKLNGPVLEQGLFDSREWYRNQPVGNDPDYLWFMEDFDGIALDATNDWTVVEDGAASSAIEADTIGGRVLLSSQATTENSGSSLQGNEIFRVAVGREIWFEAKLQISDADQMDMWAGLTINWATNPEDVLTQDDRIGFQILDGSASILCITEFSGAETNTDSQVDAVDATDIVLGFRIIGTSTVLFYVDRVLVATHTTNIVTDQNMAVAVMELSGNATGTKTMSIDYISCVMSR